ncbi:MAG: hypothetical protein V3V32_05405 [Dehalococcoidia bacterium]
MGKGRRKATIPRASDRDSGPWPFGVTAPLKAKRGTMKGGGMPAGVEQRLQADQVKKWKDQQRKGARDERVVRIKW